MVPTEVISEKLGCAVGAPRWLAGDGSDRKYYRIASEESSDSWVLMTLGPEDGKRLKDNQYPWIHLAAFLSEQGVRTPEIKAVLPDYAAVLIEDCGDRTVSTLLHTYQINGQKEASDRLWMAAFQIIGQFLNSPSGGDQSWYQLRFDHQFFLKELSFCREHFLTSFLGLIREEAEQHIFSEECQALAGFLDKRRSYLVHRDFHSRNLMFSDKGRLVTLDFQDARPGPAAYDPVSLCFDPYIMMDMDARKRMFQKGVATLPSATGCEIEAIWRETAIQRLYKILGSYGYLSVVRPEGRWEQYMESTIGMISALPHEGFPFLTRELPQKMAEALHSKGVSRLV